MDAQNVKKVGVVVISYNGRELLKKFLPSILSSDYDDFELAPKKWKPGKS